MKLKMIDIILLQRLLLEQKLVNINQEEIRLMLETKLKKKSYHQKDILKKDMEMVEKDLKIELM